MSSLPSVSRWRPRRILAAALLLGAGGCARRASESPPAASVPVASPSLRAYRDPTTGAFGEPPPGTTQAAPTAAPATLTEEAAPGGGRMIRLKGAFRSQMVGRMDGHTAAVSCETTAARP